MVAKDAARNALIVAQESAHPLLMSQRIRTRPFHWIRQPAALPSRLTARIRHRQSLQACSITSIDGDAVAFHFELPQRAAVPGQYLVLYDGEECLGSGEIAV